MEAVTKGKQHKPIKVVGIVGSPHKDGMTAKLMQQALKGAEAAGAMTTTAFLADEEMEPCRGCGGNCWETYKCVFNPSFSGLNTILQDADGLVMAVPVYCWQMNSLTHLFIDKMRWNTGSVLHPRNCRAAFGIACAGGSGTGCVLGLQALYRYFYNWAFHGIQPLPVTRFNYRQALEKARAGGEELVNVIRSGLQPFSSIGAAMADLESLPYMKDGPLDELRLIVRYLKPELSESTDPMAIILNTESKLAEDAWEIGDRQSATDHLSRAYYAGSRAFSGR
jgi:multimeric flavodoxin WrbA